MTSGHLPPDLITLPEAARRLGIGIDTAKRLVRDGEFPGGSALHVGRQIRVSVPRLERWLHGDTTSSGRSMAPEGSREDHGSGGRARVEGTATGARPDTRNATGPEIAPPSRVA